jgi:uncharacterized membrane protein
MGKSMQERILTAVNDALDDAGKSLGGAKRDRSSGPLSGAKGVAAGAGAVALAPLALKGVSKLVKVPGLGAVEDVVKNPGTAVKGATSKLGDSVGGTVSDKVSEKIDQAGGPSGILKDSVKSALPFGGGDDDDSKSGVPGVGKGRRMPVQQSVDVAVPIATAYNQWTQFEMWPEFMHRVTRVTQEDDCTVSFATKIWGKTKEFTAEIETQRPDERIKWRVTDGITHTGVVTFHELAPRLTRIELGLDVEPGGMLEKAARGMRHVKRAARADLHRFKAYIEMQEQESGAWRGVIEDGKVVKQEGSGRGQRARRSSSGGSRSSRSRSSDSGTSGSSRRSGSGSNGRGGSGRTRASSRSSSSRRSSANGSSGQRSRASGRS